MAVGVLAWKSLPPSDGKLSTLSNIKQGPDERYEDFVARLKTAVERPAEIVLKQLAYENANATCQALLRPVRSKGSLWTYIQTCQEVGTSFMQGVALATALRGETAAQVIQGMRKKIYPNGNDSTKKKCFSSGQMGHFCQQCPAKQGQQAVPIQTKTNPPKIPCP